MNNSTNIRIGIANRLGNLSHAIGNENIDLNSVKNEIGAIYNEIGLIDVARNNERKSANASVDEHISKMRENYNNSVNFA